MKALITGAAGFAGSHLTEFLVSQGFDVIAHTHPKEDLVRLSHVVEYVRVERADIRDASALNDLLRNTKPDYVYHLAGFSSPAESLRNPDESYAVNFLGTLNILEAIRRSGVHCKFLFVSSPEVYGIVKDDRFPVQEETPLLPANPYGGSKAAAEFLVSQFSRSYGMQCVIARPFNHTGPRQSDAFVCSALARQVAEIKLGMSPPVIKVGNLSASRDFSDVRDIVRGYFSLLTKGQPGEIYQLCSGRLVSIQKILDMLKDVAGTPVETVLDPSRVHGQGAKALWGVADKARSAVGWSPQYSLHETLRDLASYWESICRGLPAVRH